MTLVDLSTKLGEAQGDIPGQHLMAAMALPQAEGGAMGPKDGVGAVDRGAEARHGRPDSLLEGSDVRPFVRGRRQPPKGTEMFGGKPPNK